MAVREVILEDQERVRSLVPKAQHFILIDVILLFCRFSCWFPFVFLISYFHYCLLNMIFTMYFVHHCSLHGSSTLEDTGSIQIIPTWSSNMLLQNAAKTHKISVRFSLQYTLQWFLS